VQDITERKKAEEALRASQAELAAVFESTPILLALVDEERRVTKINRAGADFTGRPADELLGLRGGEALRCLGALDDPRGCGFGPHCEQCVVRRTVLDTLQSSRSHFQVEANFPVRRDSRIETLCLLLSTAAVTTPAGRRVLVSIEDITTRHRSHEALRAVYELGHKLVLSRQVDEIAQLATDAAQAVLRFPMCDLWLVDEDNRMLTRIIQSPAEPILALSSLPLDGERGIIAAAVRSGQTICLPDVGQDPRYIGGSYPSRSELCVPLKVRERTIGALNAESDRPDAFSPADRELMEALANAAAVAIENARLYEETHRRAAHQQALNAIITTAGVVNDLPSLLEITLEHILAGLGLAMGAIWVQECPGGPIAGRVVRGLPDPTSIAMEAEITAGGHAASLPPGELVVVNDWRQAAGPYAILAPVMAQHDVAASITAPIGEPNRPLGELSVAARQPRAWTAEETALVEAVGRQLAGAIERLQLLRQIQRQAAQMQEVLDNVPAGVLLLDADHRILMANPLAREYLASLDGVGVGEALARLGERPIAEFLQPSPTSPAHQMVIKGPPEQNFTVRAKAVPLESTAATTGWVLVLQDVTQERAAREHIETRDRLAAVGQLAAGIAHDFNNILAVIILHSYMIGRAPEMSAKTRERLTTITQQAEQASKLIEQILDFSRRAVLEPRPLDLLPFLKEEIKLLRRILLENIRVALDAGREPYVVNADPTRLQQAFMNLAVNARDAMPAGGRLRFTLDRLRVSGREPSLPGLEPGEWVRVRVADTGTGIAAEVLPRIFEPFFTTKAPGKGTGLGLSQVYGIIKQHGGEIDVHSQPGNGAEFILYLPAHAEAAGQGASSSRPEPEHGAGQTILVVEDNETTRIALAESLEMLGYRVLTAEGGREALALLARRSDDISLVLSDLVMPEMGGKELLQALRAQGEKLPVIILTGHVLDERIAELREYGLTGWLLKPPNLEELAKLIKTTLVAERRGV
jgi:signal transduction histidine kinase/ActR/RegA family two-component response regulator